MKKLALVVILLAVALAPVGCRAVMLGTQAVYQAGVALIDPVDSGHFWEEFGDYLKNAGRSLRNNLRSLHRTFDRHLMLYDWDDPTL